MRWAGYVALMGEKRNVYRLLAGKPGGKRPLGKPKRRWADNIKMDLLEIELGGVDWIALAQDRYRWRALMKAVMNLRVPYNARKLPSACITCGLSSGSQLHRVSQSVRTIRSAEVRTHRVRVLQFFQKEGIIGGRGVTRLDVAFCGIMQSV
jgi:hypothetical protein